jgi:hypothetical protein
MKILFISDGLSLKTGQGVGARRNLSLVKKISKELLVYSLEGGIQSKTEGEINYIGYNENIVKKIIDFMCLRFYYNQKTENLIINSLNLFNPDLVFIDSSNLGRLAKLINKYNKNIVTYFIDFNTLKIYEMLRINGFRNVFKYISLFINEMFCIKYSKAVYILTEREKLFIQKFKKNIKVYILPITIEDKFLNGTLIPSIDKETKKILFVGANYYPNIIGIQLFIDKIFSKLKGFDLIIAGKNLDNAHINTYENNKIKIYSNLNDSELISCYIEANIVICPIFHGGGMKIKIAEGLMFGKVIVASTFALLGYDKNILSNDLYECENIESFYKAILLAEKTPSFVNKYSDINRMNYLDFYTYKNSEKIFKDSFHFILHES